MVETLLCEKIKPALPENMPRGNFLPHLYKQDWGEWEQILAKVLFLKKKLYNISIRMGCAFKLL